MSRILDKKSFRSIIASLTGLSDGATWWDLDPQPFVGDQDRAQVTLQLFSIASDVGVDEHRRVFGPPGYPPTSFVTTEIGNRTLHITVRVEAFDATVEAAEILDLIRTGIRAETVRDRLNAINIALVDIHPANYFKHQIDERMVNAAICDFVFAGISQIVSNPNTDYIVTVNTTDLVPGTFVQ